MEIFVPVLKKGLEGKSFQFVIWKDRIFIQSFVINFIIRGMKLIFLDIQNSTFFVYKMVSESLVQEFLQDKSMDSIQNFHSTEFCKIRITKGLPSTIGTQFWLFFRSFDFKKFSKKDTYEALHFFFRLEESRFRFKSQNELLN